MLWALIFIFLEHSNGQSAKAAATANTIRAVVNIPHHGYSEMIITPTADGRVSITSNKSVPDVPLRTTVKSFSRSISNQLLTDLWKHAGNFSKWNSDLICEQKETWIVELAGVKKQICTGKQTISALRDFQRSVSLILRKTKK